jgi:hypothetical protein
MQGAPMRGVQELVGHQSLAMTQRYSHLSPAALDATIRLLENRATLCRLNSECTRSETHQKRDSLGRTVFYCHLKTLQVEY